MTTSPGLRKAGGLMNVPQPSGSPRREHVAGPQRDDGAEPLDRHGRWTDLLADVRVLAQLSVDVRPHADVLPVGKLVLRDDARPHRAERVEALSEVDLVVVELHGASADVVDHRVSEDVVERVLRPHVLCCLADHDAELDLVVDREPVLAQRSRGVAGHALDDVVVGGDDDVLTRADDCGRQLREIPAQLVGGHVVRDPRRRGSCS